MDQTEYPEVIDIRPPPSYEELLERVWDIVQRGHKPSGTAPPSPEGRARAKKIHAGLLAAAREETQTQRRFFSRGAERIQSTPMAGVSVDIEIVQPSEVDIPQAPTQLRSAGNEGRPTMTFAASTSTQAEVAPIEIDLKSTMDSENKSQEATSTQRQVQLKVASNSRLGLPKRRAPCLSIGSDELRKQEEHPITQVKGGK